MTCSHIHESEDTSRLPTQLMSKSKERTWLQIVMLRRRWRKRSSDGWMSWNLAASVLDADSFFMLDLSGRRIVVVHLSHTHNTQHTVSLRHADPQSLAVNNKHSADNTMNKTVYRHTACHLCHVRFITVCLSQSPQDTPHQELWPLTAFFFVVHEKCHHQVGTRSSFLLLTYCLLT